VAGRQLIHSLFEANLLPRQRLTVSVSDGSSGVVMFSFVTFLRRLGSILDGTKAAQSGFLSGAAAHPLVTGALSFLACHQLHLDPHR
jgi:hypothetical protein